MYQCNPFGHKFDRPMIKYDDSNDEQYDQCPDCGTDDFIDLTELRKESAINDVLVAEKCSTDMVCVSGLHYTAMEITCMTYIREKFDTQKDFTQLMQLILDAERLQLPKEFIEGLKNDLI